MRPDEFRLYLDARPFRPFRVTLTDGRTYDVMHPELALVGRTVVTIGLADTSPQQRIADRMVMVSLLHVMQVEPLETAPPVT
jgi:hypothetical protein